MDKDPLFRKMWDELGELSFHHRQKYGKAFSEVYTLEQSPEYSSYQDHLSFLRKWLLIPYSFWPVDFSGLSRYICKELREGRRLQERLETILRMLRIFPAEAAQKIIIAHEREVEAGEYGHFIRASAKYTAFEQRILNDPQLKAEWEEIKRHFKVTKYRSRTTKVARRTMVMERNFKSDAWKFETLDDEKTAYQLAMDSFCKKWNLYGMEGDTPLLLKLSVNVTPYMVLIGIPCYLLPDFKRDIIWKNIAKLLDALGAEAKGAERARMQQDRIDLALRIFKVDEAAQKLGHKGKERFDHIIKEANLTADHDERKIRKLIAIAKKHLKLPSGAVS